MQIHMQKQYNQNYYDEWSWFNCIGDIYQIKQTINKESNQTIDKNKQLLKKDQMDLEIIFTKCEDIDEQQQSLKRKIQNFQQEQKNQQNLFWTQNSSSNEQQKKGISFLQQKNTQKLQQNKQKKQHIYSKNYRQKKKQQMKILQEQNQILRKRITELQFRLRQKQIEINRIKHQPPQISLKVDELNQKFIDQLNFSVQKDKQYLKKQQQKKSKQTDKQREQVIKSFYESYDKYGFAGSNKIQSINYYFNEIIECIFRDSEKYLCMLTFKNKENDKVKQKLLTYPGFQLIHNVFYEIVQLNQQLQIKLYEIFKGLQPFFIDLKNTITIFYGNFQKIIASMKNVHAFMRSIYPKDLTLAKKRTIIQKWFEQNKYTKLLRKLRIQWFDLIRNDYNQQIQNYNKKSQAIKKKKTEI